MVALRKGKKNDVSTYPVDALLHQLPCPAADAACGDLVPGAVRAKHLGEEPDC